MFVMFSQMPFGSVEWKFHCSFVKIQYLRRGRRVQHRKLSWTTVLKQVNYLKARES